MPERQKQLLVLGDPAWRNRADNPYNALLSDALSKNGCRVSEMTRRARLFSRADVVHLHWPQPGSHGSLAQAFLRSSEKLAGLTIQKARGAVIVWTVHNIRGHDQKNKLLEAAVMGAVLRLIDGVIFLSDSSREEAVRAMPALAKKPQMVIPHGLYEVPSSVPQSSTEARARFGLEANDTVMGFLGDIKPYKGLPVLLDAFAEIPPGRATLFIAGIFSAPENYARDQRARVASLIEKGHRIVFVEQRLNDEDLSAAVRACDIVMLPYREIANSGFALFVLGLGGRIVSSDALGFLNLEAELGPYWIRPSREGGFHSAIMEALSQIRAPNDDARMAAFRDARSWLSIGRRTTQFYRQLRSGNREPAMEHGE